MNKLVSTLKVKKNCLNDLNTGTTTRYPDKDEQAIEGKVSIYVKSS